MTVCDPYFSYTSLLLHFDDGAGATTFADSSSNAFTVTGYNGADVETSTVLFGSGALAGNGLLAAAGSYASVPIAANGPLDLSSGDWTAETFVYVTTTGFTNDGAIFGTVSGSANAGFYCYNNSSGPPDFIYGAVWNGSSVSTQALAASANTWHHLAMQSKSGFCYMIVDGIPSPLNTVAITPGALGTGPNLIIGNSQSFINAGNRALNGYLDETRITKGLARYPLGVTTPTTAFMTGANDPIWAEVAMMLHFDGAFTDSSSEANTVTAHGGASLSALNPKFGSKAALFNMTGEYLSFPVVSSGPLDLSTDNFCIEGWFQWQNQGGYSGSTQGTILDMTFGGSSGIRIYASYSAGNMTLFAHTPVGGTTIQSPTIQYDNNWHYFCLSRNGLYTNLWLDGASVISNYGWSSFSVSNLGTFNGTAYIGQNYDSSSTGTYWIGQIDEVRITKGNARYPFIVPTAAFGGLCSTTIPNVVGQPASTGESTLVSDGFMVGSVTSAYSASVSYGDIISTAPSPGVSAATGSAVDIQVSIGPSGTIAAYGKFVGPVVSNALTAISEGNAEPKIWRPIEKQTARSGA